MGRELSTAQGAPLWNPDQYNKFQQERSRPFYDLMAMVRTAPQMAVADLGCGTGELTSVLHAHLQSRSTIGVDCSEQMLAKSAAHAAPNLTFQKFDISQFAPAQKLDLIFSNAAIQWVPEHEKLISRLFDALCEHGQLAIQMPMNDDHLSHQVARKIAAESPFVEALQGYTGRRDILTPERYAEILDALGFREQLVRVQVYVHHLQNREGVVEWVRGAMLTDYEGRMPPDLYAQFLKRYREELLPLLADTQPFVYPFKRIFIWGQK